MKRFLIFIYTSGLLVLMCLFFQTCKKDKVCNQYNSCENFPPKEGFGISVIKQMPFQKHAPCYNPNNGNEIIYVKEANNNYQLIKLNLQSKVETVVLDNTNIVGQPKWGKNGWIVFSKLDLNVYIIKDNGDSIRQVTHYFENTYPTFMGKDKIFFVVGSETSPPGGGGNKVIDLIGNRLDSLKVKDLGATFGISDINSNLTIASWICGANSICSIKHFDFINKRYLSLYDFEFNGRNNIQGIYWHPNNEDIYYSTYREGIFKVNKNSKTITKIKCGCDSKSYRYLSISPDGSKLIVERVDATDYQNKTGSWTEEGKIIIMDIDGSHERNIFE